MCLAKSVFAERGTLSHQPTYENNNNGPVIFSHWVTKTNSPGPQPSSHFNGTLTLIWRLQHRMWECPARPRCLTLLVAPIKRGILATLFDKTIQSKENWIEFYSPTFYAVNFIKHKVSDPSATLAENFVREPSPDRHLCVLRFINCKGKICSVKLHLDWKIKSLSNCYAEGRINSFFPRVGNKKPIHR